MKRGFLFYLTLFSFTCFNVYSQSNRDLRSEVDKAMGLINQLAAIEDKRQPFDNGLYWELNNGVLTISGNGGSTDWYSRPWKSSKDEIKKVIIQNGVRTIGKWAFYECSNLSTVTIPQSVTSIGEYAFTGCPNLKSIVIPNSVVSMPRDAMWDAKLESIVIPYSLKHAIPYNANSICMPFLGGTNNSTYYIVQENSQSGLQDVNKNWLIPLTNKYSEINPLVDNYLLVKKNGKSGLITFDNKEIVPAELDALVECGTGFLRFKINGFWGVMNYAGKVIIPTDRGYTKIGDYVSLTKRFPYEMDGYKGECNNLGVQVSKIKVNTPTTQQKQSTAQQSTTSSNSTSNTSNKSNGTTQTVVVEHRRDPVPVQEWQACWACGGMGTMGCDFCGGSGTKYIGDNLRRCSRCNGGGIIPCNVCFGNKGKYITVYR